MPAKPIMIQGTMSGAGKTLLVAGLCRVFAQDGLRVAPFKSQNMALNSAVTRDGDEIGRAQAMQAEAAGIEPTSAMNPILLKPTSDVGSQVVVRGRPRTTMSARDYFAYRATLKDEISSAYDELAAEFDVVVVEGAGSPVELNLRRDDIVNMGLAHMLHSPVLLVGDIDRGGVFAQLIGTMMLFEEHERDKVRALLVNKFRGDVSLFDGGVRILEERTGVPVAGVVPYLRLDLDDEDSVSSRLGVTRCAGLIDVAVVRLPRISNFTDFIALDALEQVGVRYVSQASELGKCDLVVIPGTKSTMADLAWLRERGLDVAICRAARAGTPVLGICGGYQMLGVSLSDPHCTEEGGSVEGLGLLPVSTVFGEKKRTVRASGSFGRLAGPLQPLSYAHVYGYEVHMGTTRLTEGSALLALEAEDGSNNPDGCQQGNVYGCYLHGLFDDEQANQALVRALLAAKGMDSSQAGGVDMAAYRRRQYDLLADGIRKSVNMDLVYRILEEGI